MADRDEKVATLIFGSVSNLESNLTKFLAEATDAEIVHMHQRLCDLEREARMMVNPQGREG